jgi:PrtD family type I secretion system ABC transporter
MGLPTNKASEARDALGACRRYFATAAAFSLAVNLLYLAAPLYMLQVYDRVVSSASEVTLVMLTVALLLALAALAGLDSVRTRILSRAGIRLDQALAGRVVEATVSQSSKGVPLGSQYLRDFDTFRQFTTGAGIGAVFDLPWAPIYILVIFLLHPLLGAFALASGVILVALAILNQWAVNRPLGEAAAASSKNYAFTDMSMRNAEVVLAMGMMGGLLKRWGRDRMRSLERQLVAADRSASFSGLIKFLRMAMQSLVLGLGAYLVIERMATTGAMFAASILLARALQPVEQIVGSWRSIVSARDAYKRFERLLTENPVPTPSVQLPRPTGKVSVESLLYAPLRTSPILRNVTFGLEPAEALGIIGASGAGKSTLARLLVGIYAPSVGAVRLDGADVATWPRENFGQHVGYLPQDIELFADTVAANISRFGAHDDGRIIAAARMAGVHEMILRLPQGYETEVGEGGTMLSGGLRQRIGLARAVYGEPSLVVLDEPSSNLDLDGDAALLACITQLKKRGTTVVMISHRPHTLSAVDKLLVLKDGGIETFGSRSEVLARFSRPVSAQPFTTTSATAA